MQHEYKITNANILPGGFRNFEGRPTKWKKAGGACYFNVKLSQEQASYLAGEGFTIGEVDNPADPDAESTRIIKIVVSYLKKAPFVVLISGDVGTSLDKKTIKILDTAEITNADIVFTGSPYDVNGNKGYTAYLSELWATIAQSPYASKYKNLKINPLVPENDTSEDSMPFN